MRSMLSRDTLPWYTTELLKRRQCGSRRSSATEGFLAEVFAAVIGFLPQGSEPSHASLVEPTCQQASAPSLCTISTSSDPDLPRRNRPRALSARRSEGARGRSLGSRSWRGWASRLPDFMKLHLSLTRGSEGDPVKTGVDCGFGRIRCADRCSVGRRRSGDRRRVERPYRVGANMLREDYLGAPAPLASAESRSAA